MSKLDETINSSVGSAVSDVRQAVRARLGDGPKAEAVMDLMKVVISLRVTAGTIALLNKPGAEGARARLLETLLTQDYFMSQGEQVYVSIGLLLLAEGGDIDEAAVFLKTQIEKLDSSTASFFNQALASADMREEARERAAAKGKILP